MTFEFGLLTESFSLNWVEVSFVSGLVFGIEQLLQK